MLRFKERQTQSEKLKSALLIYKYVIEYRCKITFLIIYDPKEITGLTNKK
jgi:hypothetical protein